MPGSGIDLYAGIGGATEAALTAAALKTLGGEMLVRMWSRDEAEQRELLTTMDEQELRRAHATDDLVSGSSAIFCGTSISDSPPLPGIMIESGKVVTSSILLRVHSRPMRTLHDLDHKKIRLRSTTGARTR